MLERAGYSFIFQECPVDMGFLLDSLVNSSGKYIMALISAQEGTMCSIRRRNWSWLAGNVFDRWHPWVWWQWQWLFPLSFLKKKPFEVALAIISVIMPFPEEDRELNSESCTMRHCYANVRVIWVPVYIKLWLLKLYNK